MSTIKLFHKGETTEEAMSQSLFETFEEDRWDIDGDKVEGDELFRELYAQGCNLIAEEFLDGNEIVFVVEFPDDSVRERIVAKYLTDSV